MRPESAATGSAEAHHANEGKVSADSRNFHKGRPPEARDPPIIVLRLAEGCIHMSLTAADAKYIQDWLRVPAFDFMGALHMIKANLVLSCMIGVAKLSCRLMSGPNPVQVML